MKKVLGLCTEGSIEVIHTLAAPTAGSCGALPGAVIGAAIAMNYNDDQIVKALFAAGIIGVFIAKGSTFAADELL